MKRRLVSITPELILSLIKGPLLIEEEGLRVASDLPNDVKAVRCGISERGDVNIVIESSEFTEVEEGLPIPLSVTLRTEPSLQEK